jgi:hypothetical protein
VSQKHYFVNFLMGFALLGLAAATSACTPSAGAADDPPPLPSDGTALSPAGPNCYPDVDHCASYPTGSVTKKDPIQQPPQPQK